MKLESVEGIVLSEVNYRESSKILNILTDKYGVIGVISKGCRNMKSKLRGASRKLIYGKFLIRYNPLSVSTLIEIDVLQSFSNIMMDLERISYASFLLDLVYQVLKQNDSEEIFPLLKSVLLKLEDGFSPLVLTNILELKLLHYLGVSPNLDSCSLCGSPKGIVSLSSSEGGFICRNCYQNGAIAREDTIKIIRMYYYVDVSSITKLDVDPAVSKEINTFIDEYYDKFTGVYVKSKDFIRKVNQLTSSIK